MEDHKDGSGDIPLLPAQLPPHHNSQSAGQQSGAAR